LEFLVSVRYGLGHGTSFGADSDGIAGVFDVGAGDALVVGGEETGADAELWVRAWERG
jgi:hypothetical protein